MTAPIGLGKRIAIGLLVFALVIGLIVVTILWPATCDTGPRLAIGNAMLVAGCK